MTHRLFCLFFLLTTASQTALAQTIEVRAAKVVTKGERMDESTVIYDEATGRRITIDEFAQINRDTPRDFRLVPEFNEFGKPSYYVLKKKTEEERRTGHLQPYNDYKRPEVGQSLPPFVMEGADGNTYRLEDLTGSYVLLSFWVKLSNPFFRGNEATKDVVMLLEKAQAKGVKLVSLGLTHDSGEECEVAMSEYDLGFVPIPNARGFLLKYSVPNPGTYFLIGPEGTLLAIIEQDSPLPFEKYFRK